MLSLRQRKWYQRSAFVAVAALLWSQFALSAHGGCLDAPAGASVAVEQTRHHNGCGETIPTAEKALCDAHCSVGDVSSDNLRTPSVFPAFAGAWLPCFPMIVVVDGMPAVTSTWVDSPPRPAWHRPTDHPAALLLI